MVDVNECTYQLWSSGLETWEYVRWGGALSYVHSKRVGHELYEFYQDDMGRWFRRCAGPAPKDVLIPE